MLYSNTAIAHQVRTFKSKEGEEFQVTQVTLGNPGPIERTIILTCPEGTDLVQGMNENLTIGYTNSFRPRIKKFIDRKELYLLLSSKTKRYGSSHLQVPKEAKKDFHTMLRGYGMEILSQKKFNSWEYALARAPRQGIVRVSDGAEDEDLYLIKDNVVLRTQPSKLLKAMRALGMTEMPCEVAVTEDGKTVVGGDWVNL